MRIRPLRRSALALLAIPALALTACAGESAPAETAKPSADVTAQPDEERSLVVYSGRSEDLVQPIIDAFTESTGIEVEVRYGKTVEMAAQLLEEGDKTPAEVFLSQEAGALGELRNADMLTTLPAEITGAVDANSSADDGTWVGLTGRARVVLYDSEELSADEAPGDVHDLTDPKWQGRFGFAPTNASFQSFLTAMRVLEGDDKAEEWLTGVIANGAEIFEGNGAIVEAVNTGALDLGLTNHYYWVPLAKEAGGADKMRAQLKFGDPGTVSALVNVTGAGILSGAADSAEALEFVEFLVSSEAQTMFVEEAGEYSLIEGGPTPADVPKLADLGAPEIDYSELADLKGTLDLLQKAGLL